MTGLMAVVRALRFHAADPGPLRALSGRSWRHLLHQTDQARLTLPLGIRCREFLPEEVRTRIDANLAGNAVRNERIREILRELATVLEKRGVEFVVLKGVTHWPYFCDVPAHRPQYDIDLYSPDVEAARRAAELAGFEPLRKGGGPVDHLPPMVRRTSWRWKDDYYDPDQPPSLELHFRFWSPETERLDVKGPERFWARRTIRDCGGLPLAALSLPDTVSYAALHLLRHLLRGDLLPYHVYELAHFLERSSADTEFWESWHDAAPPSLRSFQAVAFRLATAWYGCRLHPIALDPVERLPHAIGKWFELFATSPITAFDQPNKDALLLHLALVGEPAARRDLVVKRLLPRLAPATVRARLRAESWSVAARRTTHHALALVSFTSSVLRWRRALRQQIPPARKSPAGTAPG